MLTQDEIEFVKSMANEATPMTIAGMMNKPFAEVDSYMRNHGITVLRNQDITKRKMIDAAVNHTRAQVMFMLNISWNTFKKYEAELNLSYKPSIPLPERE